MSSFSSPSFGSLSIGGSVGSANEGKTPDKIENPAPATSADALIPKAGGSGFQPAPNAPPKIGAADTANLVKKIPSMIPKKGYQLEVSEDQIRHWAQTNKTFANHQFFRTSGTSGNVKWIALADHALEWSALTVNQALEISTSDVLGLALPEIHVGGFGLVLRARLANASLARFDQKWHPKTFTLWCQKERVTVSSLVPTQLFDLVQAQCHAPSTLRKVVIGGGSVSPQLLDQARELNWPAIPSYGMTETSSQVATGDGLPLLPGWDAKIIDGRIALRGPGLLTAIIHRHPQGFTSHDPKIDGWFTTQDLGERTHTGLHILGRADRQVKILGKLIDLDGIEQTWRTLISREVSLIHLRHERNENALILFYEGPAIDLTSLNQQQAGPERLAAWHSLPQFPRSALGKIDRSSLKKLAQIQDC